MVKIAETTSRRKGGVYIEAVDPGSLAESCGLEPDDKIFSINGHVIPDSLSFQFNVAMPELNMVIEKADGERWELDIENEPDIPFGVKLKNDPIMLCRNKCIFCFVDQNPRGYRQSLLIKDEDIRLSFMYGNYSTLSSTDAAEEERIIREKISPLYVSVHATDPATRIFMLKNKTTGNIVERLKMFADHGIEFHAQVVLCPGINDGEILTQTLNDLATLWPACLSIAVVPLGITSHRKGLTKMTSVSDAYCAATIDFCKPFQTKHLNEFGRHLVLLGDEFYIRAGRPIPARRDYDDFPQMENGIGMVRRFIDGFKSGRRRRTFASGLSGTLVTGTLFGGVLEDLIAALNREKGTALRVAPIRNEAFGADLINVAGLVHGADIISQLRGQPLGDFVLVPHVMLKDAAQDPVLIDDLLPGDLADELGVPIVGSGNSPADLLKVLADWRAFVLAWPQTAKEVSSCPSATSKEALSFLV